MYVQAEHNIFLTEPTDVIDGYKIRPFLIGDGAYLANTWLLKPFPNNLNLSQKQIQQVFIFRKSSSRACFWDFKDKRRWRCLLNCLDHNTENQPDVIISCCVLHNICQMKGGSYIVNEDVLEHTLQLERERTQRREEHEFHASANTLRDIQTDYVNAEKCCKFA